MVTVSSGSYFSQSNHDFWNAALRCCLPRVSDEFAFSQSKIPAPIHDALSLRTCVHSWFSPFVCSSLEAADHPCLRCGRLRVKLIFVCFCDWHASSRIVRKVWLKQNQQKRQLDYTVGINKLRISFNSLIFIDSVSILWYLSNLPILYISFK